MERNKFITSVVTLVSAPLLSFARLPELFLRKNKGFKINAGEGRKYGHLQLKGVNANVIDIKVSGSDTEGGLAVFEQTSLSQGKGTPLHIHNNQDEYFYVLEGSYYFQLGEEKFSLTNGDSIFLPRGIPHAWTQVSAKGKMMVTLQPAGKLEDFFVTMAGLDHEPSPEEMTGIFLKNDMQVVGPPLKIE